MTRSTDECEMSRSCHSATSSSAACRLPRSTRANPDNCSDFTGFRLCGIALEPFCSPSRNGSSTSRTSVRCRCRISTANDSTVAPSDAHAYMHFRVPVAGEHLRCGHRLAARGARTRTSPRTGRRWSTCRPRPRACRPRSRRAPAASARGRGGPASPRARASRRTSSAPRGCRGYARPSACRGTRGPEPRSSLPGSAAAPMMRSIARVICSASAVSTTSLDVSP